MKLSILSTLWWNKRKTRAGEWRSWRRLVLGEEYILVRKATSGRRFRFPPERRAIAFSHGHASRPSYWHRACSYAGFGAMAVHAVMWECGWLPGRVSEKVELGLLLRISV